MGVSFFSLDMVWLFVDCGGGSFTAGLQRAGVLQRVFFGFCLGGIERLFVHRRVAEDGEFRRESFLFLFGKVGEVVCSPQSRRGWGVSQREFFVFVWEGWRGCLFTAGSRRTLSFAEIVFGFV